MNLPGIDEIQQQGMVFLDENGIKRFFGIGGLAFIAGIFIILIRIFKSEIGRKQIPKDSNLRFKYEQEQLHSLFKEQLEKSKYFQNIHFSLLYKTEGRDTLIILVEHHEDVAPDARPVFYILKQVVKKLKPQYIRKVKLQFYLGIVAIP